MAAFKNKDNGTWYVQFLYSDWRGERQQKLKRGFPTKKAALAWEREFLMKKQADLNMTLESFVELYTQDVKPKLKLNTWLTKECIIQKKILPYLGKRKLSEITPQDIFCWQNEIRKITDKQGKPLSTTYLKTIHNQMSAIFNHAVRYYGLQSNPAAKAGSMGEKEATEMQFWTKEVFLKVIDAMMDSPIHYYAFEMLYWCGLRIGERLYDRLNNPAYLHTVTLNELYETAYPSRPPIIDGLLYPGTYLLAGAPKVGKSFLVAQLAYHISTGQPLWDYPVRKSTVLYLALEDDYKRLQDRMFRMFGVDCTEELHFATCAKQIGNGLEDQLELFLKEHPDTRLVIVDTLQKVREISGEAYSYASDYEIVGKLKQFADKYGICLLLVHHTRKQPANDKFEMISGTTGLLGCSDGAFLLQKERGASLNATLDIVGRDQGEQKLYLVRDRERLVWELDHAEAEVCNVPPDPILEKLHEWLDAEWTGSATELVQILNLEMKPNALTRYLNVNTGRLENEHGIVYQNARTHSGRIVSLKRTQPSP